MNAIDQAINAGRTMLSEYESKKFLASYKIPVTREALVDDIKDLTRTTQEIGYPVVLKGCSSKIAHKTERGLIRVDVRNDNEAREAFKKIMTGMDGDGKSVLVQELIKGQRELVIGMTRDVQFGPCVMFGLGGIFTEILKDITFRIAPLERRDAVEMMKEIKGHKILDPIRGMDAADLDTLADILINVGRIGLEDERIQEIDINPLIISGSKPVAVDALMVLRST